MTEPVMTDTAERCSSFVSKVAVVLKEEGRERDATLLEQELRERRRQRPMVVVAGEDKRGKSSVVNALLRRDGLSPVGVESTTGSPITFFASSAPQSFVMRFGSADREDMPADAALSLATVPGNPGNREHVRSVYIGTDSPVLEQMDLVDTPGVGGLDSGHGALTLQTLASADALVFVLEATTPIRAPELRFLQGATSRIDSVVLVLNKTDLAPGWRTVVDDDCKVIAEQAPRLTQVNCVPLSCKLARRAERVDGEEAEAIREESGAAELERLLVEMVGASSAALRASNATRAAISSINLAERVVGLRRQTLAGSGEGLAALQREQRRLAELNDERAEWGERLDTEIRELGFLHSDELSKGTVELRRKYEARLHNVTKSDFDSLPGELVDDLIALAAHLSEVVSGRLDAFLEKIARELGVEPELRSGAAQFATEALEEELKSLGLGDTSLTGYDRLSVMSSFSSGHSLGSLSMSLGASSIGLVGGPIGLLVGLGLGGLFAFHSFKSKSQSAYAGEFRPWMSDQLSRAQTLINNTFSRCLNRAQGELRRSLRAALAQREADIASAQRDAQALAAKESEDRASAVEEADRRLAELEELRAEGLALLEALHGSQVPPTPEQLGDATVSASRS